jgi:hypothetical protein
MIRWVTRQENGRQLVTLGITEHNVRKLKAREPLYSKGEEIGMPFDIVIVYGRDQEQILRELQEAGVELPPGVVDAVRGQP